MNKIDWQVEHERFMRIAYPRTMKAAQRAFSGWHVSKQTDSVASCIGQNVGPVVPSPSPWS